MSIQEIAYSKDSPIIMLSCKLHYIYSPLPNRYVQRFNCLHYQGNSFTQKNVVLGKTNMSYKLMSIKKSPIKIQYRQNQLIEGNQCQTFKLKSVNRGPKDILKRYMGPKQTCNSMNKDTHKFYNDFLAQSDADIRRPKILDKKKIKEKQKINRYNIVFKSVKSAHTDLFIQTHEKPVKIYENRLSQAISNETQSFQSLGRISIDQRVFQN